ncbi:uncharacterized protein LOC18106124 [Populus trichocarpa]|uniref:uncharacterized protein LOC18106124 n=1 Tax=Populus trichocarpa TaxID=3694 RepID=UPI002278DB6E|nr:uncharacterized protein LOC18106124 [Populus trichocarpa]
MATQTSKTPNESRTVATKVAKRKLNRLLLSSLLFSQQSESYLILSLLHESSSGMLVTGIDLSNLILIPMKTEQVMKQLKPTFFRNVVKDIPRPGPSSPGDNMKVNVVDCKAQELVSPNAPLEEDRPGEVKMEASITPDDVIRAGGFGARDDINSFLPVASDSTGFEATILDARNYEEPQGEIQRPGLDWTEATERKQLFCQSLRPSCHRQLFLVVLASDILWHVRNM